MSDLMNDVHIPGFTASGFQDYVRYDRDGNQHIIRPTLRGTWVLLYRGRVVTEVNAYITAVTYSTWCEKGYADKVPA